MSCSVGPSTRFPNTESQRRALIAWGEALYANAWTMSCSLGPSTRFPNTESQRRALIAWGEALYATSSALHPAATDGLTQRTKWLWLLITA
jgi:hypothetical protein